MSDFVHAKLGPIAVIDWRSQPRKTWKHFYHAPEHWERLVPSAREMAREAEQVAKCLLREHRELPELPTAVWEGTAALIRQHHDAAFGPAYMEDVAHPETRWTSQPCGRYRLRALSPRGVFCSVQLGTSASVLTAFRPLPPYQDVNLSEDRLYERACHYFDRQRAMTDWNLHSQLVRRLEVATAADVDDLFSLWRLASAVGYARLVTEDAELAKALSTAETKLAGVDQGLAARLRRALQWEEVLDEAKASLAEGADEEFDDALARAEELLVAGVALGARVEAKQFAVSFEELVAWVPETWEHLLDMAAARTAGFDDHSALAMRLWDGVAAAVTGAMIRHTEPASVPEAVLVDAVLPANAPLDAWWDRVTQVANNAGQSLQDSVDSALSGIVSREPAPAMGADKSPPWPLQRHRSGTAPRVRVFVVERGYPDGEDVTDWWVADDAVANIWELEEPGQSALVLVFASDAHIPALSAAELLDLAVTRGDIAVSARSFTRPT